MRPRKYTAETIRNAANAYSQGVAVADIAKSIGASPSAVYVMIREAGAVRPPKQPKETA